jgi:hypothetical protein
MFFELQLRINLAKFVIFLANSKNILISVVTIFLKGVCFSFAALECQLRNILLVQCRYEPFCMSKSHEERFVESL